MRINTNIAALNAYRNLSQTNNAVSSSMEKLSSGFRINRAADDAAGFGIANKLRGDIRAMNQASRNTEQANSVLQIAEGATSSIQQMLERMKELATQAGSDSVDAAGRGRINAEFTALREEITRTVATTKFQGGSLLDGTFGSAGASLAAGDITNLDASVAGGTYSLSVDATSGALTVTGPGSFSKTVNLEDATFATGKLSFAVAGLGTISVAADDATDAASVVEGLNGRGFDVTAGTASTTGALGTAIAGVSDFTIASGTAAGAYSFAVDTTSGSEKIDVLDSSSTVVGTIDLAGYTDGTDITFDDGGISFTIDGSDASTDTLAEIKTALEAATLTVTSNASAAAATATSTSAATAGDYSTTTKDFDISVDGGAAQTITLDGNYADVGEMVTDINAKLSTAGITTVTVAEGSGADAGKLVWTHSETGSAKSFSITDTDSVLGGDIATTSGTDAGSAASITADSITGNPEGSQASFLVGASGAYDTDDLIKLDAINLSVASLGIDAADLTTADGARTALASIDSAMDTVNETLGDIGASQNRIGYAMSNLKTSIQNFTAAESVIRDVDMAEEMTKFSKNNILAQAGTAMLAQANQSAQGVLQLLRG